MLKHRREMGKKESNKKQPVYDIVFKNPAIMVNVSK